MATLDTTPELLTVATPVLLLVQLPPVVALVSVIVVPIHTVDAPVMAAGVGLMVSTCVVWQPVASL